MTQFNKAYISPHWPGFKIFWALVAVILFIVVFVLWLLGYCPGGKRCPIPLETVERIVEVEKIVEIPSQNMGVSTPGFGSGIRPNTAKLYFDIDSTDLFANAELSLAAIISFLRTHSEATAVVSSFHTHNGTGAQEQNLAKTRAEAVCKLLQDAGISEDRIIVENPAEIPITGAREEAHRVDVKIGL